MDALNNLAYFVLAMIAMGVVYGAAFYMDYTLNKTKKGVAKKLRAKEQKNLTSIKPRRQKKNSRKKKKTVL